MMNNTSKILTSAIGFLICAALGFFATQMIQGDLGAEKGEYSSTSQPNVSNGSNIGIAPNPVAGDTPAGNTETENDKSSAPEIVKISTPKKNAVDNTYSFIVTANGSNLLYHLADKNKDEIGSPQTDCEMIVPATPDGVYYVFVSDGSGLQSEYSKVTGCLSIVKVKKITAEEMSSILNSGNAESATAADFKNRVSPGCRLKFTGISDEEEVPSGLYEVINRINLGTWSSVVVNSMSYNDADMVSAVSITVMY